MTAPRARADALAAALLVLISVVLWLPRLAGPLDLRYDAGVYYILGTSLAEGHGYRLLNEPGAIAAIQYPPLLPLLIAAHVRLAGTSDPAVVGHALRWTFFVCFVAYVLVVHRLCRRWLDPGWAFAATLLVTLHLQLTWLSDLAFAELPFALCTMLFVLLAESPARVMAPWLLAVAAYLLRSTGIAALAAWAADAALHRRYRQAMIRAVLAIPPLLAWQLFIGSVQRSAEYHHPTYAYQRAPYQYYNVGYLENMAYLDPFIPERGLATRAELAGRVLENLRGLPTALGESVSGDLDWMDGVLERRLGVATLPAWIPALPFALLGFASIVGNALLVARGAFLGPLYWAGSLLLIALTPWPAQFNRYLMPLAPLTAIGFATTLARLTTGSRRWWRTTVAAGVGAMLAYQILVLTFVFTRQHPTAFAATHRLFFYDEAWRSHDEAIAWLARNAPDDAVVATSTPHWIYLATGLRSVFPPFDPDVAAAARALDTVPVAYVVVDDMQFVDVTRRYAQPVVTALPDEWTLAHGTPTTGSRIYRHRPR